MLHMRRGLSEFDDLNFLDAEDIAEEVEDIEEGEEDEEVEEVEDPISSQLPPAMPAMPPAAPEAAAPTKRLFTFSAFAVQPPPPNPAALGVSEATPRAEDSNSSGLESPPAAAMPPAAPEAAAPPKRLFTFSAFAVQPPPPNPAALGLSPEATPGAQVEDSNSSGSLPPIPPTAPEAATPTKPLFTFSAIAVQPPPPNPAALGPSKAIPRAPPRPPPNPFDASQQLGDPGAIQELLEQCFALRSCMLAYKVANSGSVVASMQSWKVCARHFFCVLNRLSDGCCSFSYLSGLVVFASLS
jgi:hypothetical protein